MKTLFLACSLAAGMATAAQTTPSAQLPLLFYAHGVVINVTDMDAALAFYVDFLGFAVESREHYPATVTLQGDERHYTNVTLRKASSKQGAAPREAARSGLSLHVNDLRATMIKGARQKMLPMELPVRVEQVGVATTIADPFGTPLSLMDTTKKSDPLPREPRIYNYGLVIPADGYERAHTFWCDGLGFITRFDRFLPFDQALFSDDKAFGFMLHMRQGVAPARPALGDYPNLIIQLATPDLDEALAKLKTAGAEILFEAPATDAFGRRYTAFREPFGVPIEVVELK